MSRQPVGQPVSVPDQPIAPESKTYTGRFVSLEPLQPKTDAPALFEAAHNYPGSHLLWTYMAYGPFDHEDHMAQWMTDLSTSHDPLFLTVHHHKYGPVGMVSFLNIVPQMLRLELGNIWYAPRVWRSEVNTEVAYIMMSTAFDDLGYRRVEWKCDALNEKSRNAALRLGFSFEGIFQQHMIVKGCNRDTAWFAMMDHQWPKQKARLEQWLYDNPQNLSLNSLKP